MSLGPLQNHLLVHLLSQINNQIWFQVLDRHLDYVSGPPRRLPNKVPSASMTFASVQN